MSAATSRGAGTGLKTGAGILLAFALVFALMLGHSSMAQQGKHDKKRERLIGERERLIGAWHLVRIDVPGESGPQPVGMLIYTRDGRMSVQLMYPQSASALSNEYVRNGYEASFGSYTVDEASHTVTHHVQGSITGNLLVGKDLPRRTEFTPDGHLVIRSTRPDEHWSVTWQRY